jgi:broad specificity phosphatase PhoE
MTPLRLALVRHGRTLSNVERVMDTAPPGAPLDDTGRMQAARLVRRFAGEEVVAVYASPATRAQETAAPLAAHHDLAVTVRDGLREVDVGVLEGTRGDGPLAAYDAVFSRWAAGSLGVGLPGGESAHDVLDRYLEVVDRIVAEHTSGLVVLVSHGGAIRIATMGLVSTVTADMVNHGALPNTGLIMLEAMPVQADRSAQWQCLEWAGIRLDSMNEGPVQML